MIKKKTKKLLNNQGQGVMEYLIITSLVGIICLVTLRDFGRTIQRKLGTMDTHINNKIKIKN